MQYDIVRHGNEQEPIAIIDDFSSHFDMLFKGAHEANFAPAGAAYPGIRSRLSSQYLAERRQILSEIVRTVFGFSKGIDCESCDYSIVTTLPQNLSAPQCIPHYDAPDADILAMMHYMLGPENGGTAFYRHRASGFESITIERQAQYNAMLRDEMTTMGPPPQEYLYGDCPQFDMIGEVESRPNRLILYRGRALHSGCISKNANLSPDPRIGRVTINGFLRDRSY